MDEIKAYPIKNLIDAYKIASIRNECRHNMTNSSDKISLFAQTKWYFRTYKAEYYKGTMLCLLFKLNNEDIGFGFIKKLSNKYWITGGLISDMRGKGLGSVLFKNIISLVSSSSVWLEVLESNIAAKKIYIKLGFKKKKIIERDKRRIILMSLNK